MSLTPRIFIFFPKGIIPNFCCPDFNSMANCLSTKERHSTFFSIKSPHIFSSTCSQLWKDFFLLLTIENEASISINIVSLNAPSLYQIFELHRDSWLTLAVIVYRCQQQQGPTLMGASNSKDCSFHEGAENLPWHCLDSFSSSCLPASSAILLWENHLCLLAFHTVAFYATLSL